MVNKKHKLAKIIDIRVRLPEEFQMTLGSLIKALGKFNPNARIATTLGESPGMLYVPSDQLDPLLVFNRATDTSVEEISRICKFSMNSQYSSTNKTHPIFVPTRNTPVYMDQVGSVTPARVIDVVFSPTHNDVILILDSID